MTTDEATDLAAVLAGLRDQPTAAVTDGMALLGMKGGWLAGLRARSAGAAKPGSLVGTVMTIQYAGRQNRPERGLGTYDVIEDREDQTVLLIAGGSPHTFRAGGNIAAAATLAGFELLVVDGSIRDSDELRDLDLAVLSTSVEGGQPSDDELVAAQVPVVFAGTWVVPGDVLVADQDGAVVFPQAIAADVLREAQRITAYEERQRDLILKGAPLEELKALMAEKSRRSA